MSIVIDKIEFSWLSCIEIVLFVYEAVGLSFPGVSSVLMTKSFTQFHRIRIAGYAK